MSQLKSIRFAMDIDVLQELSQIAKESKIPRSRLIRLAIYEGSKEIVRGLEKSKNPRL